MPGAAADPAAQLVQLSETEALGVLDHHHPGCRHVDSDLDHRGRHQQPDLAAREVAHRPVLVGPGHAAVDQAHDRAEVGAQHRVPLLGAARSSSSAAIVGRTQYSWSPRSSARRTAAVISSRRASGRARVRIGGRPGGFSRSSETAMSPYSASTSVRGIRVAVITSRSVQAPLAARLEPLVHAERCCSSTTASARSAKRTSSWNSACAPTAIGLRPCARSAARGPRGAALAPGQQRRGKARRRKQPRRVS